MSRFDGTQAGQISRMIEESRRNAKLGRVKEVMEHVSDNDNVNFNVDVKILGEESQHRAIPYQFRDARDITVPTFNDLVLVEYLDGEDTTPVARSFVPSNEQRPPKGRAGEWRRKIPSVGVNNLYIESYTNYEEDPSRNDPRGYDNTDLNGNPQPLDVEEAHLRIAKKQNDGDYENLDASIELFDSATDDSYIEIQLDGSWGLKLNMDTGEFKLLDGSGYGIVSDGSGNFTWHHESVDFSEGTTDSL